MKFIVAVTLGVLALLNPGHAQADELLVAAASNFRDAMAALTAGFEAATGHRVTPVFGSTGKHYAQIHNGAPFDAFFAADSERPLRLEREGLAVPGSRFTYAVGKLVLWSPRPGFVDPRGEVLRRGGFRRLAIANPQLAPYGQAAREVLAAWGLLERLDSRLVRGENVGQAFQFVRTGNAELGLLAWSQLKRDNRPVEGSWWLVPADLHAPIEQQAVLLRDSAAGRAFMSFVRGDEAARMIRAHGYETPR